MTETAVNSDFINKFSKTVVNRVKDDIPDLTGKVLDSPEKSWTVFLRKESWTLLQERPIFIFARAFPRISLPDLIPGRASRIREFLPAPVPLSLSCSGERMP